MDAQIVLPNTAEQALHKLGEVLADIYPDMNGELTDAKIAEACIYTTLLMVVKDMPKAPAITSGFAMVFNTHHPEMMPEVFALLGIDVSQQT